jgi:inhibitor of KinA
MMGFIPGFAYLGGMSSRIATPRLETPRTRIPGGSVGIAGSQTGIYPAESPGGWQIIGRIPIELFYSHQEPPALLQTGNYIAFVSITPPEFISIKEKVQQGVYKVKETPLAGRGESGNI